MRLHHIGIAVSSIVQAQAFYETLGYVAQHSIVYDRTQHARLLLLEAADGTVVELCEPVGKLSSVQRVLDRGVSFYHVCYAVDDLEATVSAMRKAGVFVLGRPVYAPALSGKICWGYTQFKQLIEVLQLCT